MKEEVFLSYEEFVIGIKNKTVKLTVLEPTKETKDFGFFENGSFSNILNKTFVFFTFAPILAIPIVCYLKNNWLLLLGFGGIFIAMFLTGITLLSSNPKKDFIKSILSFTLLPSILLYFLGVFHVLTFISLSFYYEYFFTMLSNLVYENLVKQNLLKDPNSYYGATIAGRIKTYRVS